MPSEPGLQVERWQRENRSGALHHFRPEEISALIASRIRHGEPFIFFDVADSSGIRKVPGIFLPILFALNFLTLFLISVPVLAFLMPFSLSRLVFTYCVPAIPVLIAWDGTVSALRAYMPDELLKIAKSADSASLYEFQSGQTGRALYIMGISKSLSARVWW